MFTFLITVNKYNSNDQAPKLNTVNAKALAAGLPFFEKARTPTAKSIIAVIKY